MQQLYITLTDDAGKEVHTTGRGPPVTSATLDIYGKKAPCSPAVVATIAIGYHPDQDCYTIAVRKTHPRILATIVPEGSS